MKKSDPHRSIALESLHKDQVVLGFAATAVYLDDTGGPMGARFVHCKTGFTLDYLVIESAPQGCIWVNTWPTSDRGEPHIQEHLLLGKGNKGRYLGSATAMSLAESSAFTMQWRTCYHFHTVAAHEVFWQLLQNHLDALLNPDYSDEEIRREVCHFGVTTDSDGTRRLEEQGTIYNEMVRAFESPFALVFRAAGRLLYGAGHPLAMSSGGYPDAIRTLIPADIRRFHRDNYHLANMGMIGAFPRALALDLVLRHTGTILDQLAGRTGPVRTAAELPPAQSDAAPGTIEIVDYPHENPAMPGPVWFMWPAVRDLDNRDLLLLQLFLDALAGDDSTDLYRRFVASDTRVLDTGATRVWAQVDPDMGQPVFLGVDDVRPAHLTAHGVDAMRAVVVAALARIAGLPAGDPELAGFHSRIHSRIVDLRRRLSKLLNSPPGFGLRSTGPTWLLHLHAVARSPGFHKSLTMQPEIAFAGAQIAADANVWRDHLRRWQLLDTPIMGVAARANPALLRQLKADRDSRIASELARLQNGYGTATTADTTARYQQDYDRQTAALEAASQAVAMPSFTDAPPMTLDDHLDVGVDSVGPGIERVTATFDNMTSATVGVAFRLDSVPPSSLILLSLLPVLMTEVGIHHRDQTIAAEVMKDRLRAEILQLSVSFSSNFRTGRAELLIQGAGNDVDESKCALQWMRMVLHGPDWRPDNLPRIRDVLWHAVTDLRNRMLASEELWVQDPAAIYWRQNQPLLVRTSSFLTRAHDAHRLRWMLEDAGDTATATAVVGFLDALANAGETMSRSALAALADALQDHPQGPVSAVAESYRRRCEALPKPAQQLVHRAARDLAQLLGDLPDSSLAADWAYLCQQMGRDLKVDPTATLADLHAVRREVLKAGNARMYVVAATATQPAIAPDIDALVAELDTAPVTRQTYPDQPFVLKRLQARLRARCADATTPVFVGLVNPNTQSGVFVHTVPGCDYTVADPTQLLRYLASNLYAGHGAHSMFVKTWAAGLAYSNGLRSSLESGRFMYYAERCPELAQTLRFVIRELRRAQPDPGLADYAVAQAFTSRVASAYEVRGAAMAADLADGISPELVRQFRTKLLALRQRPDLAEALFAVMASVYGDLLPGYGPRVSAVADGVFLVIGPENQMARYEEYLQAVAGAQTVLYRLYPRDYWIPAAVD